MTCIYVEGRWLNEWAAYIVMPNSASIAMANTTLATILHVGYQWWMGEGVVDGCCVDDVIACAQANLEVSVKCCLNKKILHNFMKFYNLITAQM